MFQDIRTKIKSEVFSSIRATPISSTRVYHDNIEHEDLVKSLQKVSKERDLKDLSLIKKYLEETNFFKNLKNQNTNNDENSLNRISWFFARYMDYLLLEKDSVLFREDDFGDKFYLIIEGQVSISKSIEQKVEMTPFDYIRLLLDMKNKQEYELIKKTIKGNSHFFPISQKELDDIYNIILKVQLKELFNHNSCLNDYVVLFSNCEKSHELYEVLGTNNFQGLAEQVFIHKIKDRYFDQLKNNEFNLLKYYYLEKMTEKKTFRYFELKKELSLSTGSQLGDFALMNKSSLRTATVKTEIDTHFGYVNRNLYISFVSNLTQISRKKEIDFFHKNFFPHVNLNDFENKYFHRFKLYEFRNEETIFQQGDDIKSLYFIREGEIELVMRTSLFDLQNLIVKIISTFNIKHEDNISIFNDINGNGEIFRKMIKFKIVFYGEKQIMALKEYFMDLNNHLYTAKVVSATAKIYTIGMHFFRLIINEQDSAYRTFKKCNNSNIKNFMLNLINQRNYYYESYSKSTNKINKISKQSSIRKRSLPNLIENRTDLNDSIEKKVKLKIRDNIFNNTVKKMKMSIKSKFDILRRGTSEIFQSQDLNSNRTLETRNSIKKFIILKPAIHEEKNNSKLKDKEENLFKDFHSFHLSEIKKSIMKVDGFRTTYTPEPEKNSLFQTNLAESIEKKRKRYLKIKNDMKKGRTENHTYLKTDVCEKNQSKDLEINSMKTVRSFSKNKINYVFQNIASNLKMKKIFIKK